MDGKLAMLRGSANALGGFLDQTADGAKIVACSLALAISTRLNRPADAATIIVILLYVGVRSLALTAQISFPAAVGEVAYIGLDSVSPLSVFKAGLRRATRPGTTVDGEAIAFSLAPAIGLGWIGFLVGALLAILEVVWMLAKGIALSRRPADRGEAQPTLRAGPVK
jgi:phosphatidylglycerophosphate synthase